MASGFPVNIGSYATKCLFDSGASYSCMSYRCFKSAFPLIIPTEVQGLTVQNASGRNMQHVGMHKATITLGIKSFKHTFIICEELTSAIILGLDSSSRFRIGSDWICKGTKCLHQGKQRLIEGIVKEEVDYRPHLILKTHVTLPPTS